MSDSCRPVPVPVLVLVLALLLLVQGSCRSAPEAIGPTTVSNTHALRLDAAQAKLARVVATMVATMEAAPATRWDDAMATYPTYPTYPCREPGRARALADGLAMPGECTIEEAQEETRAALRTVLLALARDMVPLVARLQELSRDHHRYGEDQWFFITDPVMAPTVVHVDWMVEELRIIHEMIEGANLHRLDNPVWQEAGRHYEVTLLGAQVLSVWVEWLEFGKVLHSDTTLSVELILVALHTTWRDMEPYLNELDSGRPARIRDAARSLQSKLPEWADGLYRWGQETEQQLQDGARLLQTLLIIQIGFDLVTMHHLTSPLIGQPQALTFVFPGIGGLTASGAMGVRMVVGATSGVRLVVSAEWLAAIKHLIATGAISAVELGRISGGLLVADTPAPGAIQPAILQRVGGSGDTSGSAGSGQRTVTVQVRHHAGNRQVEVDGQRWHLPKNKQPSDIPATDPVGDRL